MSNAKYTVSRFIKGKHGVTYSERVTMRALTLETAKYKADRVRGGFVCRLGSNVPVYDGAWTL